MRWNDEVKAAVKRNEAAWEEVLGASDEEKKERCIWKLKEKKRERLKGVYIRTKRK